MRRILRVGLDLAVSVQDRAVAGFDYDALRAPCHPVLRARALDTMQAQVSFMSIPRGRPNEKGIALSAALGRR
jgi:hypothetical protein